MVHSITTSLSRVAQVTSCSTVAPWLVPLKGMKETPLPNGGFVGTGGKRIVAKIVSFGCAFNELIGSLLYFTNNCQYLDIRIQFSKFVLKTCATYVYLFQIEQRKRDFSI